MPSTSPCTCARVTAPRSVSTRTRSATRSTTSRQSTTPTPRMRMTCATTLTASVALLDPMTAVDPGAFSPSLPRLRTPTRLSHLRTCQPLAVTPLGARGGSRLQETSGDGRAGGAEAGVQNGGGEHFQWRGGFRRGCGRQWRGRQEAGRDLSGRRACQRRISGRRLVCAGVTRAGDQQLQHIETYGEVWMSVTQPPAFYTGEGVGGEWWGVGGRGGGGGACGGMPPQRPLERPHVRFIFIFCRVTGPAQRCCVLQRARGLVTAWIACGSTLGGARVPDQQQ